MSIQDRLVALLIVLVWGVNFYFMRLGLDEVSPMVLGMLRFVFVLLPAVLLLPRPPVAWYWLAAYGLTISFGLFGLMFSALALGLPTGLAALMLQAQVFFTVLIAGVLLREPVQANHVAAMGIAAAGLLLIGVGQYRGALPMAGLLLMLCSALSWALGNTVVKRIGRVNQLALVVWGNVFAVLPFGLVALWQDGVGGVWQQISHMTWRGWAGVLFLAYVSSLMGYVGWGALLARHPASKITPLALLVPVVALLVGYVFLREQLNAWHWAGMAMVMGGLLVQVFGRRWWRG